jgi:hypothetical protein
MTLVAGKLHLGETKSKRSRVVTLPAPLVRVMRQHLEQSPPGESGWVFTGDKGAPINRNNLAQRISEQPLSDPASLSVPASTTSGTPR